MPLREYIINDIKPIKIEDTIKEVQLLFSNLTYSHIPVQKDKVYLGCISEADASVKWILFNPFILATSKVKSDVSKIS
jgi:predicted transcriptional regulator